MNPYHQSWLLSHQDRDEAWLMAKLAEGFDIHHIDGDRDNNDPANLVLIEHADHMRLHGLKCLRNTGPQIKRPTRATLKSGAVAYDLLKAGREPEEIKKYSRRYTLEAAELYANENGLEWPIGCKCNP